MSDLDRVSQALRLLHERGYATAEGGCCQRCVLADLDPEEHWVFYTDQDYEMSVDQEDDIFDHGLYISWGGDADEIAEAFRTAGLGVFAPDDDRRRFQVFSAKLLLTH